MLSLPRNKLRRLFTSPCLLQRILWKAEDNLQDRMSCLSFNVLRESSRVILFDKGETDLPSDLQGLDFVFLLPALLGIYAIHRLVFVEGIPNRKNLSAWILSFMKPAKP